MHRILGHQKSLVICENQFFLNNFIDFLNKEEIQNYCVLNDLEVLPYDLFSPHQEKLSSRLDAMIRISNEDNIIVLSTINSLIQPYFDKKCFNNFSYEFCEGKNLDRDQLIQSLSKSGYKASEIVSERSEYAIRGSVIDIFPANSNLPLRIDLDDEKIESIRVFDKDSQISFKTISKYKCRSSKGFELDKDSIALFKKNWRQEFAEDGSFFDQVSKGYFPDGIESYFPLFYEKKPSFNDFFSSFSKFSYGKVEVSAEKYWKLIKRRFEDFISDENRPPLKPEILYNNPKEILKELEVLPVKEIKNISFEEVQNKEPEENIDKKETSIEDFYEFTIDKKIVHSNYGIGIYRGLKNLNNTECFVIEYEGEEILYIPVDSMNVLSPYVGNQDIKLDSLSKNNWKIKKEKSEKKAYDIATELLEAEAKRKIEKSEKLEILDETKYQIFKNGFGFKETNDQNTTILQVINDLNVTKPQDRLICGEVGFGKTEIALRASFICTENLKQVCILAPTTLLARQHFELFKERFKQFDVKVEFLSRERTQKEKKEIIEDLKNGNISIIIGTHSLLSDSISFADLGLLVIDEEHRFGVRQKEKLRTLRKGINVIYLSATPIPRSLNLALSKVRDISIISSPPPGRKAVETIVSRYSNALIKEALEREFHRSGQSFYLLNSVSNLDFKAKDIRKMLPDAKVTIAHGQMSPKDLKETMIKFHNKEIDILVCTTIIESGLDIPNANTLIVESTENFGLSQLHQIRGRVGRSKRQAYAYFLTSEEKNLTKNAVSRIEALKFGDSLNSGFNLAMRDLEIRGAGEILGEKQSGVIDFVGLTLFTSLIDKSIKLLKGDLETSLDEIEIKLGVNGYITEESIPQPEVRLSLYKKISSFEKEEDLFNIKKELEDRFGKLPKETENLIKFARIRILSSKLLINKILSEQDRIYLFIDLNSPLKPENSKLEKIFLNYSNKEMDKIDFVLDKLIAFNEQNNS